MGKKLVMAQKRGETRALCLGVAMVMCAVIAYYILGTTVLPLYQKSVWTQKSTCHLIETNIRGQEELGGKKVPQYPCLWVNVSAVGRWAVLYHTEDTRDQNQQAVRTVMQPSSLPLDDFCQGRPLGTGSHSNPGSNQGPGRSWLNTPHFDLGHDCPRPVVSNHLARRSHLFAGPHPQQFRCSYIPGSLENYQAARADVEKVRAKFHEIQTFYCFSATRENETTVLYQRLYGPRTLLFSLFWPTFLLTGGLLIIAMVKINQSLSILAAQK